MLKMVENLWAVGVLPRTPLWELTQSQRSPDPLAGGEGLLPPPQELHPRCRPSVLRPSMKIPGHASEMYSV